MEVYVMFLLNMLMNQKMNLFYKNEYKKNKTLGDVQSMYYDIRTYDMRYEEFKEMCHKAWSERFNYLYIDMTK